MSDSNTQPQIKNALQPSGYTFKATSGSSVPDDLLDKCAKLFSGHYGVWSAEAAVKVSTFLKAGQHVKLNAKKLRAQSLSPPESSVLVTCFEAASPDNLVGHAFATVWQYKGASQCHPPALGKAGWITQLVVHPSHRRQYIATYLLQHLKTHPLFQDVTAVGLASSHPASVAALAKYNDVNTKIHTISLPFIAKTAPLIIATTPINYLKDAKLLGSLFRVSPAGSDSNPGVISAIDTQFHVDHTEPLEVLKAFKDSASESGEEGGKGWVLGELEEGHEFLIVVPVHHVWGKVTFKLVT
ncbi:hypothetical protein CVT26_009440 [Gymnopilus dilepis]|uniref:N-acetyltransferase domain-containing protein n=1 Tax=Gymnopilus dilepis TaxID=231916 RepID=A0A409YI73_9AGAR|nr:hypothetical protein CVT26_009440 [Gymnopilus dilepis]